MIAAPIAASKRRKGGHVPLFTSDVDGVFGIFVGGERKRVIVDFTPAVSGSTFAFAPPEGVKVTRLPLMARVSLA